MNLEERMPIISYGVTWNPQYAMVGRCGNADPIDFRGWQIGLYVLYQRDRLMYVGKSGGGEEPSISGRLVYHKTEDKNKIGKWDRYSWFGFLTEESAKRTISMPVGDCISDIEALLIHLTHPEWNRAPGKHKHIQEFEQIAD
jgi:hypothetical protein